MSKLSSDEEVLEGAWKRALADENVLADVMYHANKQTFVSDSHQSAYNQGARELALRILILGGVIE